MDETHVRLVLDVLPQDRGGPYTRLRLWDRSVDYGEIMVQDLPFVLDALFADGDG